MFLLVPKESCTSLQGPSQSMPWLADLVESSDSSTDVLPVQCLCEFLLHDVPSESNKDATDDDGQPTKGGVSTQREQ